MNLYWNKRSTVTNNSNNIEIKHKRDAVAISFNSYFNDCGFKIFVAIDKEKLNDLLKMLNEKEELDYSLNKELN